MIDQDEAPMVRILIHACARIATVIGDSCRRSSPFRFMHAQELQQQTSRRANYMSDFDSCMREDCNRILDTFGIGRSVFQFMHARGLQFILHDKDTNEDDFDSCMREDCNERIRLAGAGNAHILIHACARIATRPDGQHHDTHTF